VTVVDRTGLATSESERKRENNKQREKKKENDFQSGDNGVQNSSDVENKFDIGGNGGVPVWRSKRADMRRENVAPVDLQRRGYFSDCSGDVQSRLRESRAKMLIAENEKKEAEAIERKRKMDSVTPEIALVTELIRVTRMANQLKKQTKDQRVGGWAETVADTLTRSTAESAPSSMPSLKSVEEGSSALKSDGVEGVFDQEREVRLAQYNVAKLRLDRCYEQEDCIDLVDQKKRYDALKFEFSDVSMSEVDRENALTADRIAKSMQDCGVDQYTIQAALEGAGFSYDLGFI